MLLTTTNNVEGKSISTYYGMVTGEAIIGANIFKDIFASITDIVGGRSGSYEKSLKDAKNIAVQEMMEAAQALGANAVIAIDLDYETLGKDGGMMMVSANGTAVRLD
ncbi:heavy metal-binding domain-containing protein [Ekhidna sp.]|uniref:heavy metal-binding domain-containing protein n=1 Tax=Ekhidna sp. TaxID=2608089 RepID=UPI0032983BD5